AAAAQSAANTAIANAAAAAAAAANAAAQAANAATTANRIAGITDFLFTSVNNNVIGTGVLLVGDALGNNNAFISGVIDNGLNSIAFAAGGSYANRYTLPFRVTQGGKVYMTNAEITGTVYATAGKIGNFDLLNSDLICSVSNSTIQMWNSTSYANASQALAFGWVDLGSPTGSSTFAKMKNNRASNLPGENVCLSLSASGAQSNNFALDIISGNIRVNGWSGITALAGGSATLRFVNGIMVGFS
ncbi:MAG TPA: hypothetical protein VF602_09445, partial [Pedobacter sp.]